MEDIFIKIKVLNPVMGCDIGCEYCYAQNINQRFKHISNFSKPILMEYRLTQLYSGGAKVYQITTSSDFSSWCKNGWCDRIFSTLKKNSQHQYIILTKRPDLCDYSTDMDNVWIGVSVTNKSDKAKIDEIKKYVKSKHYHVAFEPLFEDLGELDLSGIEWIVIGGELGSRKGKIQPEKEWVLNIVKQAREQNIPVAMKSSLLNIVGEENFIQEIPKEFEKILKKK